MDYYFDTTIEPSRNYKTENERTRTAFLVFVIIGLNLVALMGAVFAVRFVGNAEARQLPLPQGVAIEGTTLKWDTVEGAARYLVYINGEHTETEKSTLCLKELKATDDGYLIKIKAVAVAGRQNSHYSAAIRYVPI